MQDTGIQQQILSQPAEIPAISGPPLPLRMSVDYISFSAHVDFRENSEFIDQVGAPHLVLVHGDSNEMGRLRAALTSKYGAGADASMAIYSPRNCETVTLHFRGEKLAKVLPLLVFLYRMATC